jgi:hypothetical protein
MMFTERIILRTDSEEDIYSGFNDTVHPALDTRVR